jgi:hypothetical protein
MAKSYTIPCSPERAIYINEVSKPFVNGKAAMPLAVCSERHSRLACRYRPFRATYFYNSSFQICEGLRLTLKYFALSGLPMNLKNLQSKIHKSKISLVTSSGIEPESGASEALILSIVLRGLCKTQR